MSNFLGLIETASQWLSKLYKLNSRLLWKLSLTFPLKRRPLEPSLRFRSKGQHLCHKHGKVISPLESISWKNKVIQKSLNKHKNSIYKIIDLYSPPPTELFAKCFHIFRIRQSQRVGEKTREIHQKNKFWFAITCN